MAETKIDKKAEAFGITVAILLGTLAVVAFVALPIAIMYGVFFLLSQTPFLSFAFYPSFWGNFLFFGCYTIITIVVFGLFDIIITILRKRKTKDLDDIGPNTFFEWVFYAFLLIGYFALSINLIDRLESTIIGLMILSFVGTVVYLVVILITNRIKDDDEGEDSELKAP
ncbi:hypothetical protein [Ornithinibacillus sp. FSL M8-0202]|uniref:hypothetical protein n=1 Tax=Ornithinibacillus sp. FSL M8-0202 TaxID=2921616 RepID=UPI0030D40BB8